MIDNHFPNNFPPNNDPRFPSSLPPTQPLTPPVPPVQPIPVTNFNQPENIPTPPQYPPLNQQPVVAPPLPPTMPNALPPLPPSPLPQHNLNQTSYTQPQPIPPGDAANIGIEPISNQPISDGNQEKNHLNKIYTIATWIVFFGGLEQLLSAIKYIASSGSLDDNYIANLAIAFIVGICLITTSFGLRNRKKWALISLIVVYVLITLNQILKMILIMNRTENAPTSLVIFAIVMAFLGVSVKAVFPIYFWKQYRKIGD